MSNALTVKLHSYGQSDPGLQRTHNEDAFVADDDLQLYAVADGLGGLPSGDLASRIAVEGLLKQARITAVFDMQAAFRAINHEIQQAGRKVAAELGIGTTLTALKIEGSQALIGHVGDSGLLLLRGDHCYKLTKDHTAAEEMKADMEPAQYSSIPEHYHHTLTRCLGQFDTLQIDLSPLQLEVGDRILLFSDGVTKTHTFDELEQLIQTSGDPQQAVNTIIDNANLRGGPDNCTAVLLHILSSQQSLCAQKYSKPN